MREFIDPIGEKLKSEGAVVLLLQNGKELLLHFSA